MLKTSVLFGTFPLYGYPPKEKSRRLGITIVLHKWKLLIRIFTVKSKQYLLRNMKMNYEKSQNK